MARWDGVAWHALGKGFPGPVLALLGSGTGMIAGGRSDSTLSLGADALSKGQALGRWDGTRWNGYGAGLAGTVNDLAEYKGNLYASGRFRILPAGPVCGLAAWNGSQWSPVPNPAQDSLPLDSVYALAPFKGRLYAMGRETKWDYPWKEALMAWDGTAWERVEDISQGSDMVTDGEALYLSVGQVLSPLAYGAANVARFDGSNWILIGTEAGESDTRSIGLFGGYLYLGGWLSRIGGVPAKSLARWNLQSFAALNPKRIATARKGGKIRKYLFLGDVAPDGMDLYGLDGRRIDGGKKAGNRPLRAGPAVGIDAKPRGQR